MDKEYILMQLRERIAILKNRYRLLVDCKSEDGRELKTTVAAAQRHDTKRDLFLCKLVVQLVRMIDKNTLLLSADALDGLAYIMEPIERHRRLKVQ